MIKRLFLILLLISCLIIPVSADYPFTFQQTNTKIIYQIDYGNQTTITGYNVSSSSTLSAVQSWTIYGSNNATGWGILDSEQNIGFTANTPIAYSIASPAAYEYYQIYLQNGFYQTSSTVTFWFIGGGNYTPPSTPTVTKVSQPSGGIAYLFLGVGGAGLLSLIISRRKI